MSTPRRRRPASRSNQRRRSSPPRDFWGLDEPEGDAPAPIRRSEHPAALVESLGPLPFPRGEVAQHYFDLVYERAANLAAALATSAGLLETDEPQ